MNIGWALFCLFVAGAVGGVANTIITQHGFHIPRRETLADGGDIWRPGVLGDIFIGGLGGALLVVLNTPLGAMAVIGGTGEPATFGLTVGNLASSALVGVGGAQLLTNAIEKRFEQATRSDLARQVTKDLTPGE